MRILHIAKTTGHGGVSVAISDLCRALSIKGVASRVVYIAECEHDRIAADFAGPGTPCVTTSRASRAAIAALMTGVRNRLARREPQILHLHSGTPVARPGTLRIREIAGARTPVVLSVHGATESIPEAIRSDMWAFHRANTGAWPLITVPSEPELVAHSRFVHHTTNYRVLPYCIFPPTFEPGELRTMLGEQSGNRLIVGVGRLHDSKGFDTLIRAFARVGAAFKDCSLAIFGEGPDRDRLEGIIARLPEGIGARVHLLGHVRSPSRFLADADIFVSASHAESFGLIAFEAALAERPCVLSSISPWSTLFRDRADCLFAPVGDDAAFAERIMALLADPATGKRHAADMRAKVTALTSPESVAARWIEEYRALQAGWRR